MPLNISGSIVNSNIARTLNYKSVSTRGRIMALEAGATESLPETGTAWSDITGNYNGSLTNGAAYDSTGGGSVYFDGINDYVGFSNASTLLQGLYTATMTMWVKLSRKSGGGQQFQQVAGWRDDGDCNFFFLLLDESGATVNTEVRINTNAGSNYDINVNFTSYFGSWTNIVVAVDTSRIDLYLNGSLAGSNTNKTGYFGASNELRIGQNLSTNWSILGHIANFSMYNRALSAAEVSQNYNAQKSRFGL
jgi:hypothetical protein